MRQLEANLARVVPDASPIKLKSLTRKGMHSYLRYWCDAFRLPDWSPERILATCRVEDDEPVRAALAEGRGVVMALAHSGNWDHAGAWSTLALAPVTTVAERLRPEELFERFLHFRQRLGMEILPLTGGGDVFGILVRRLRKGGFVPLLADRDLTATGVPGVAVRRDRPDGRRPGLARAGHRRRAVPGVDPLRAAAGRVRRRGGAPSSASTPRCVAPADGEPAGADRGDDAGLRRRARRGDRARTRRTGTCCSGCSSPTSCRTRLARARAGERGDARAHRDRSARTPSTCRAGCSSTSATWPST